MDVEAAVESLAAEIERLRSLVERALERAESGCRCKRQEEERLRVELHALAEVVIADMLEHREDRNAAR